MVRVTALFVLLAASVVSAQPAETEAPLQCWWRTTAGGVRVGEQFSLVLTCSALENDTLKIVVDQGGLEPAVVQMPPFEVVGGSHPADLRGPNRRFFQYEYRLRIINEDVFGKDVAVPDLKLTYRAQTMVNGSAIEGRDQNYLLPGMPVRVLSLVPADAADIRDSSGETFSDVASRQFRASTLRTISGVLIALAGLAALVALARLFGRRKKRATVSERLVPDSTVLGSVVRELEKVRRERQDGGWTPALAGRLAAAIRITAGYALPHPPIHVAASTSNGHDGDLAIRPIWLRGKTAVVSSSVTAQTLAAERSRLTSANDAGGRRAQMLEELERALINVTVARYGRSQALDEAMLDEALETGRGAIKGMRIRHMWPVKRITALGRMGTEMGQRVWAR